MQITKNKEELYNIVEEQLYWIELILLGNILNRLFVSNKFQLVEVLL